MAKQSGWQRWIRAPQLLTWRRVLVQLHLWIGLLVGVYVVLLSVTGSLSVIRPDINRWSVPRSVKVEGTRLTGDELKDAVRRAYPQNEVTSVIERRRPDSPVMITVLEDGKEVDRLFDPYALRDIGMMYPPIVEAIEWVVDLHDNLLKGQTGRKVNGVGALLFFALVITGAIIWWPGVGRVRHNLLPGKPAKSARFARRLHNALGIWTLVLLFMWALTAVYLCYPDPFEWTIDYFDADLSDDRRPLDWLVRFVVNLHFGRNWGLTVRWLWVVLGLVPAVLFVTGFITWWVRVVKRRRAGADRAGEPAIPALAEEGVPN
ncbi:MAG TPA: PepSY-associated TM helix domain-containing protein [Gammaproteobacteria bacterium]|nr:PepSY-associated TM helix domain-containing protein [Gammaproteobacteria bacterium]